MNKRIYQEYSKAIKIASDQYINFEKFEKTGQKYNTNIWATGYRANHKGYNTLYGNLTNNQLLKATLLAMNSGERIKINPHITEWYDWFYEKNKRKRYRHFYPNSQTFQILLNVNTYTQSNIKRWILNLRPIIIDTMGYVDYEKYVYLKFGIIRNQNNFVKYDCHISLYNIDKYHEFSNLMSFGRRRLESWKIFLN